ncbi:MAG: hypothetical protein AAFO06_08680 [Cyanobacteria bacterium J06597_16]
MPSQSTSATFQLESFRRGQSEIILSLLNNPVCCGLRIEQSHLIISVHPGLFNFLDRQLNRAALPVGLSLRLDYAQTGMADIIPRSLSASAIESTPPTRQ